MKISIIIPIFNAELYLRECLDSIINQTYKNLEIILVNDDSTDNSEQIILEYLNLDQRIQYFKNNCNKGTFEARRFAIKNATGEYILFIDADDWISLDTCQILEKHMKKDIDIIQYSIVKIKSNPNESLYKFLYNFEINYHSMNNQRVFESFFVEYRWVSWMLCGKCIKTSLIQKAVAHVPEDSYITWSEDYLIVFICAYFANSYIGCKKVKYYYREHPASSENNLNFNKDVWIENYKIFFAIYNKFIDENHIYNKYPYIKNEENLIYAIMKRFYYKMQRKDQIKYFAELCDYLDEKRVFSVLYNFFPLKSIIYLTESIPIKLKPSSPIKTVAFMLYRLDQGGIERVTSLLLSLFKGMNYKVVLFCIKDNDIDFYSFNTVTKIVADEYNPFTTLEDAINTYNIDLIINQDHHSVLRLYILFYAKMKGIRIIQCIHLMPLYFQLLNDENTKYRCDKIYSKLADAILCLSGRDQLYYQDRGIKAIYMPNPLTFNNVDIKCAALDNHNILFVGRLATQKNPKFMIRTLPYIINEIPNTRLIICGDIANEEPELKEELVNLAKELEVFDKIDFVGNVLNIGEFFQNSAVHVMPSRYEGMPMVWGEAKSNGVPTVYTRMDYLEFAYLEGSVVVDQGDIVGFANEVIKLLKDLDYRRLLGKKAKESLINFENEIIISRWQQLLHDYEQGSLDNSLLMQIDPKLNKEEVLQIYKFEEFKIIESYSQIRDSIEDRFNGNLKSKSRHFIGLIVKWIFKKGTKRYKFIKDIVNKFIKVINNSNE